MKWFWSRETGKLDSLRNKQYSDKINNDTQIIVDIIDFRNMKHKTLEK